MRIPELLAILLFTFQIFTDGYLYVVARKRCKTRLLPATQLVTALILLLYLAVLLLLPKKDTSNSGLVSIMWLLFAYMTIYVPKLLYVVIDLLASLPLLWHHKRSHIISYTGGILAILLSAMMWWGALFNRYNLNVTEITISVPGLPDSFDSLRLVQISDLHTGTYSSDTNFIAKLVEKINSFDADAVLFTGDIVNRRTSELIPFANTLSKIQSRYGTYSILGNHDYGDYSNWPSPQAKIENLEQMYSLQEEMGWHLLLNETAWLYHDGDSIAIIGVENWGDAPFPRYGNLTTAYPSISDNNVKILMTHNPFHWKEEIADNDSANVALTLSGHTHAMQMSAGRISPASLRYQEWGGLYYDTHNSHPLYVNIGIGTVGIPMRLGATPEITVITLTKAN